MNAKIAMLTVSIGCIGAANHADAQSLEQLARQQRLMALSQELNQRIQGLPPGQWSAETRNLAEQYKLEATKFPYAQPNTNHVTGPGDLVPGDKLQGKRP